MRSHALLLLAAHCSLPWPVQTVAEVPPPLPWSVQEVRQSLAAVKAKVPSVDPDVLSAYLLSRVGDTEGCCAALPSAIPLALGHPEFPGFSALFIYDLLERNGSKEHRPKGSKLKIQFLHFMDLPAGNDGAFDGCPGAYALAALIELESMLLPLLPAASNAAPWTLWRVSIEHISILMRQARRLMVNGGSLTNSCCLRGLNPLQDTLQIAYQRADRLLGLLITALGEPWLPAPGGKLRAWLQDEEVYGRFVASGRTACAAIGRTPPHLSRSMEHWHEAGYAKKQGGLGSSASVQRRAFGTVIRVLRRVKQRFAGARRDMLTPDLEGTWWPIKGTLLLMLRHGSWHGQLSKGKVDIVDRDMDFSIALGSASAWFRACDFITEALIAQGWSGCVHQTLEWYLPGRGPMGTSWNPGGAGPGNRTSAALDGRGTSLIACSRAYPEEDTWVQFELIWNRVLQLEAAPAWPANTGAKLCDLCEGMPPSNDGGCQPPGGLGPAIHWDSLSTLASVRQHLRDYGRRKWTQDLRGLVLATNPVCEVGPGGRRCFLAASYPYQCWAGGLPFACSFPMARCGAYNESVPCAACGRQELKWFNSGKYWARLPGRPCLALPLIFIHPDKWADRMEYDDRNRRIREEGIDEEDLAVLQATQDALRRRGFQAFGPSDYDECAPASNGTRSAFVALNYSSA